MPEVVEGLRYRVEEELGTETADANAEDRAIAARARREPRVGLSLILSRKQAADLSLKWKLQGK